MSRAKTGGRKPGTPNKRTADVEQKLAALGCDPIVGMARIAMDDKNPVELRSAGFLTRIETLTARPLRARKRGPKPA